jgi:putative chitinase
LEAGAQAPAETLGPTVKSVIYKPVPMPTEAQLLKLFPRADRKILPWFAGMAKSFETAGLRENLTRLAMFVTQVGHETGGLRDFEENLNYSAERMAVVWPGRFAVDPDADVKVPNALARTLAHNPQALANNVYGGRMGNVGPDDGWTYRGRGAGLTGREAYREVGRIVGWNYEDQPALVAEPHHVVLSAIGIWTWKKLNASADRGDLETNTLKLNGGRVGLKARREIFGLAKVVLNVA